MSKRQHPELDGNESQTLYTFELKSRAKMWRDRLSWSLTGLLIGLGIGIGSYILVPRLQAQAPISPDSVEPNLDTFRQGVSQAMSAAELTQTAEFREQWATVAALWQDAINSMEAVPETDSNYAIAQQKVGEYQRNLLYAKSNVETRSSGPDVNQRFWTLGSSRSMVITIQGTPSQVERYDTLCREVLYYGDSFIELQHGHVSRYDNLGKNLQVAVDAEAIASPQIQSGVWTIGSSREEVFRFQGTPNRISGYEALGKEILFYGDSFVELENNQVIGYRNTGRNLRVSVLIAEPLQDNKSPASSWRLGSERADVLHIQNQTPIQVKRNNAICEEVFYYGNSMVELTHGVVTGYDNIDSNLRVE